MADACNSSSQQETSTHQDYTEFLTETKLILSLTGRVTDKVTPRASKNLMTGCIFCDFVSPPVRLQRWSPPSGKRPSSVHEVVWQCSRAVVILNGAAGVILIERQGRTNAKSGRSIVFFKKMIPNIAQQLILTFSVAVVETLV